jgi:competence protein ComGC
MKTKQKKGFTLVEMLFVILIMSLVLILIMQYGAQRMDQYRRDHAALQMQQILNAGLSYYVSQGKWPDNLDTLKQAGYLPSTLGKAAYGGSYVAAPSGTPANTFDVKITADKAATALVIAGALPIASVVGKVVTASVQIPGQNLNNARSVNFGSLYHHGACVPVPSCPTGMKAEILAVPSGVSGVNDLPTKTQQPDGSYPPCSTSTIINPDGTKVTGDCAYINSYPITSFSASATITASGADNRPPSCNNGVPATCYDNVPGAAGAWTPVAATGKYWRVCLSVVTEKGTVSLTGVTAGTGRDPGIFWAQAMGTILVVTRCTPSGGEPSGSTLNVWSN